MVTEVIFRKFKDTGDIIAIFPYIINDYKYNVGSYMHIGQHGACTIDYAQITKPCSESEYTPLLNELKSIGYDDLKIIKKYCGRKYRNAIKEQLWNK